MSVYFSIGASLILSIWSGKVLNVLKLQQEEKLNCLSLFPATHFSLQAHCVKLYWALEPGSLAMQLELVTRADIVIVGEHFNLTLWAGALLLTKNYSCLFPISTFLLILAYLSSKKRKEKILWNIASINFNILPFKKLF